MAKKYKLKPTQFVLDTRVLVGSIKADVVTRFIREQFDRYVIVSSRVHMRLHAECVHTSVRLQLNLCICNMRVRIYARLC